MTIIESLVVMLVIVLALNLVLNLVMFLSGDGFDFFGPGLWIILAMGAAVFLVNVFDSKVAEDYDLDWDTVEFEDPSTTGPLKLDLKLQSLTKYVV